MPDYAVLDVYVAGWTGPVKAVPTGRAVVLLDQQLDDAAASKLGGDARALVRERETNSAFVLDEDVIEVTP